MLCVEWWQKWFICAWDKAHKKKWLDSDQEKRVLNQMSKMRWNERNNYFLKNIPVDSDHRKHDSNQMPWDSNQA